jgi:hypothetical protein
VASAAQSNQKIKNGKNENFGNLVGAAEREGVIEFPNDIHTEGAVSIVTGE